MDIFEDAKKRSDSWEKVDRTVDTIAQKFGKDVIKRGTLSDK
jgi:tetrahydromethanopterin S-methyltransferase subunit G